MTTTTTRTTRNGQNGSGPNAIIAGAAGFGLGLLAAAGRKAVVQAPTAIAGDWFEGLKAEHKMARAVFEKLGQTRDSDTGERAALLLALQHAIGKHNVEEEYVVYCVLRENGQEIEADELHAEHGELKQALYELEQLDKGSPDFLSTLGEARAAFEEHVRAEEEDVFPKLHATLTPEQTKALTSRMNREGFKVA